MVRCKWYVLHILVVRGRALGPGLVEGWYNRVEVTTPVPMVNVLGFYPRYLIALAAPDTWDDIKSRNLKDGVLKERNPIY